MRTALLAVLTFTSIFTVAQDSRVDEIGNSPVEAKFASGGTVRMDLCSSGIEVIGKNEGLLRVSFDSRRNYDEVRVRIQVKGNQADLKVTGCPRNNFQVRIEVPQSSNLFVRMFAGQLDVKGITGDKDVQLRAGQLDVEVGDGSDYAHVDASVNSGQIEASPFGVSKGGLFRSFDRNGPGKYRLHAHVGAGQLDLR